MKVIAILLTILYAVMLAMAFAYYFYDHLRMKEEAKRIDELIRSIEKEAHNE